jgi:phosphoglycolate phosphatase
MSRLQLLEHLDFLCGCDSGHGEKPDPGMVLAFCRACGLSPGEVAVVGDTPHDMNMARAAGVGLVVAVTSGAAGVELLQDLADHVIADVSALPGLLGARGTLPPRGCDA